MVVSRCYCVGQTNWGQNKLGAYKGRVVCLWVYTHAFHTVSAEESVLIGLLLLCAASSLVCTRWMRLGVGITTLGRVDAHCTGKTTCMANIGVIWTSALRLYAFCCCVGHRSTMGNVYEMQMLQYKPANITNCVVLPCDQAS